MPRYYDIFVPPHRQSEGMEKTIVNEDKEDVVSVLTVEEKDDVGVSVKRSEAA